jgi:hypothetical protein
MGVGRLALVVDEGNPLIVVNIINNLGLMYCSIRILLMLKSIFKYKLYFSVLYTVSAKETIGGSSVQNTDNSAHVQVIHISRAVAILPLLFCSPTININKNSTYMFEMSRYDVCCTMSKLVLQYSGNTHHW